MQQNTPILSISHVKKDFSNSAVHIFQKKKTVLHDVSLDLKEGECVGLLGANGSGKSTLLSIIAGIQHPDDGVISYYNSPLTAKSGKQFPDLIGYVPQENPLIPELSAWDNLKLWYSESPLSLEQELENGFLSLLGIPSFLKVPVKKMSGGMKKRLSIGCCIACQPKVLLLDEPGAALDLPCKERIETYLNAYRASGNSILLATHEEHEIKFCDRLYLLKDGATSPYTYDGNIHHLAKDLVYGGSL